MIRIGFDIGGTNIKAGLFNGDMNFLSKKSFTFQKESGYRNIIKTMYEISIEMLSENNLNKKDVCSIGVASAGEIDIAGGIIIRAHNLGFYNVPIQEEMSRYFPDIPISLINDADAAALAELKKGALQGYNNAILITIGTGIGGGIIIGGKLYRGGLSHGAEVGHVIVFSDGPLCTCGNRGCIETLCSATWLAKKGQPAGYADAKAVIDAAKNEEPVAIEIFNEYIDNFGMAIASLTNLLDPEIIALGGGVSLAGDFLFDPLRKKVEQKSFFKYPYKITAAQLGNDAGTIGSAAAGGE